MQEETEAEAKTTSMEEDYSILDESEGDQDEMLTTAKETAKKSSESVSALVNNFLKVQVGSNNVFENGGPNTSTSTSKFPSLRNTPWLGWRAETGWQPPLCLVLGHWVENRSVSLPVLALVVLS